MSQQNSDSEGLNIIFVPPKSNKARLTKIKKQKRFSCKRCFKSWVNKKQARQHVQKCIKQIQYVNKSAEIQQQEDVADYQNVPREGENMAEKLQMVVNELSKIKRILPLYQSMQQFNQIESITRQIVQADVILGLIKTVLDPQILSLVQKGFQPKDIIVKGRLVLFEEIKNIELEKHFSNHDKNMQNIQNDLKKKWQNVNQKYAMQLKLAFLFIKSFNQKQLKSQSKIIEKLSGLSFYKRSIYVSLYQRIRLDYPDMFNFGPLPKRLLRSEGGNKIIRKRVNVQLLFDDVRRLLRTRQYQLACDIWVAVCLGLRQSQFRIVQLRRGTGEIAKVIHLLERKNCNSAVRLIPKSLANMICKHNIEYPISTQRFEFVRRYCLNNYGTFYSLRSLAISLILSKLAQFAFGRFHRSIQTTKKYYLDLQIQQAINGIFILQGYNEDCQSDIQVFLNSGTAIFKDIAKVQLDFVEDVDFLQQSFKDSICNHMIEENDLTLSNKLIKNQLQRNIQIGQQITIKQQGQELIQFLQQVCLSEDVSLKICQARQQNQQIQDFHSINEYGSRDARIIETISQNKTNLKVDESKMSTQQFMHVIDSFRISSLPVLRSFVKCFLCNNIIKHDNCGDYFKVHCPQHGSFNECKLSDSQNFFAQRFFTNTCKRKSGIVYKQITLQQTQNNIKQIIKRSGRKYLKRTTFQSSIHPFKISFPLGKNQLFRCIKHVQDNEMYLPILIKQTKLGYGVFATQNIEPNTLICTYTGEVKQSQFVINTDDSILDFGFLKTKDKISGLLLTCTKYCNLGRYFNSTSRFNSKSKNLALQKYTDQQGRIVCLMFSIKSIKKNEQIKWFYGQDYWVGSNISPESDNQDEGIIEDEDDVDEDNQEKLQQEGMSENKQVCQQNSLIEIKKVKCVAAKSLIFQSELKIMQCNPDLKLQVASIIKLIVAKVCLDMIDQKLISLDSVMQAPFFWLDQSTRAYLKQGKQYTVEQLISGMLIASGCDSAHCLAFNLGSLMDKYQPIDAFVEKMQQAAQNLEMNDTKIVEHTGYGNSVSTSRDLVKLARWMRLETRIHKYLSCQQFKGERILKNTNKLIHKRILGKTGFGINDRSSFIGFLADSNYQFAVLGCWQPVITFSLIETFLSKLRKRN